jgi:tetratricopeptide (TPR) repeat protein
MRNSRCAIAAAVVGLALCLSPGTWAGEAEDEYLRLFQQMRSAEQAAAAGETEGARRLFEEVRNGLQALQRARPAWNPEVVAFRLRHVHEQLAGLSGEGSAVEGASAMKPGEGSVLDQLRTRLGELEAERDLLRARLREALSAQPAGSDPLEMRRAEERIREQQRELDVLRFQLAELRGDGGPGTARGKGESGTAEVGEAQPADLRRQLRDEQARSRRLERQAEALEARVRELEAGRELSPADRLTAGRALMESGRLDEAVIMLGRAAQEAPESAEILAWLGRAMSLNGMSNPAETVLKRALELDADCGMAHLELSREYTRRQPPLIELARSHYREAGRCGMARDPSIEERLLEARRP